MELTKKLRLSDVAEITGWSKSWIYHLTSKGLLKHYKPSGKTLFFEVADIQEYLEQGAVSGKAERDAQAIKKLAGVSK